jgi:hypothetical protein
MVEINITREYLQEHPNEIFVFGDNSIRKGNGGAAKLRSEPNTYGFITKKFPKDDIESYYRVDQYEDIFWDEVNMLKEEILKNPDKIYLISRVGAGLANLFGIWEAIIEPNLREQLEVYPNVKFLWTDDVND